MKYIKNYYYLIFLLKLLNNRISNQIFFRDLLLFIFSATRDSQIVIIRLFVGNQKFLVAYKYYLFKVETRKYENLFLLHNFMIQLQ